ncbi:hypothetical protein Drorol1_Dr00018063 [Drosera rotundifolia]
MASSAMVPNHQPFFSLPYSMLDLSYNNATITSARSLHSTFSTSALAVSRSSSRKISHFPSHLQIKLMKMVIRITTILANHIFYSTRIHVSDIRPFNAYLYLDTKHRYQVQELRDHPHITISTLQLVSMIGENSYTFGND